MSNPLNSKLGERTPAWKLEYLVKNAQKLTIRQMEEATGLSNAFIIYYFIQNKVAYKRVNRTGYKHVKVDPITKPPQYTSQPERPPANYSNKSREQLIDEYLNMDI